jgi:hypothetical protein
MVSIMAVCVVLITGCTQKEATPGVASPAPARDAKSVPSTGKPYDCDKFSLTLTEGWAASPLSSMGMVNLLPKGKQSPGLYFKFEGDGNAVGTAEESITTMIRDYNGSSMESKVIGGIEFKTTSYTSNGSEQTMLVAYRDGTKITITIEGAGGKDNADIQAMLGSVAIK